MVAFSLASLSIIGIPPLGGFISKWYLAKGVIEAGEIPIIAVLVVSTILNACYFLPIIYRAFFKELPQGETAERKEAPALMVVPLVVTTVGTLLLFFVPSIFLDLAKMVVTGLN
jgi:multicomponent Na+:H+ antiporter subunit D